MQILTTVCDAGRFLSLTLTEVCSRAHLSQYPARVINASLSGPVYLPGGNERRISAASRPSPVNGTAIVAAISSANTRVYTPLERGSLCPASARMTFFGCRWLSMCYGHLQSVAHGFIPQWFPPAGAGGDHPALQLAHVTVIRQRNQAHLIFRWVSASCPHYFRQNFHKRS